MDTMNASCGGIARFDGLVLRECNLGVSGVIKKPSRYCGAPESVERWVDGMAAQCRLERVEMEERHAGRSLGRTLRGAMATADLWGKSGERLLQQLQNLIASLLFHIP